MSVIRFVLGVTAAALLLATPGVASNFELPGPVKTDADGNYAVGAFAGQRHWAGVENEPETGGYDEGLLSASVSGASASVVERRVHASASASRLSPGGANDYASALIQETLTLSEPATIAFEIAISGAESAVDSGTASALGEVWLPRQCDSSGEEVSCRREARGWDLDSATHVIEESIELPAGTHEFIVAARAQALASGDGSYGGSASSRATVTYTITAPAGVSIAYGTDGGEAAPKNTPAGTGVVVGPLDGVTLTFERVDVAGNTAVARSATVPALPTGFAVGDPPLYYDISTDAGFTGSVLVCISYADASFAVPPSLLHNEGGAWSDATESVDQLRKVVCGRVTSLSPFVVGLWPDTTPPVLELPSLLTRNAIFPTGVPVTYHAAAVDDRSGPVPVTCTPASGSTFPIGRTIVNCTARDIAGNTATGSFSVDVLGPGAQLANLIDKLLTTWDLGPLETGLRHRLEAMADKLVRTGARGSCVALKGLESSLKWLEAVSIDAAEVLVEVRRIKAVLGC